MCVSNEIINTLLTYPAILDFLKKLDDVWVLLVLFKNISNFLKIYFILIYSNEHENVT